MNILRKYRVLILTFFAFFFSSSSCLYDHEAYLNSLIVTFSIQNNEDELIYVSHICANENDKCPEPSSVFKNELRLVSIPAGEKIDDFDLGYNESIDPQQYPEWKHFIIIFRKSTMERYSKKELIENNICDAVYELTADEIRKMNSVVKYPLETNK